MGGSFLHDAESSGDSEDDLFGDEKDEDDTEDADATNPYDYRHFIKSASQSSAGSQASSRQHSPARNLSPHVRPSPSFKPSPLNGAQCPVQQQKPKAKPKPMPNPSRAILPEASPQVPSPFGKTENHSSDGDDDDVLTIELDDGPPKRKNRFHNAFKNLQGDGPISMRSAASSVSPGVLDNGIDEDDDGDEVLVLEGAEEEEVESDEDVEEGEQFRLPSPIVGRTAMEEEEEESDVDEDEPKRVPIYQQEEMEADEENEIDEFEAAIARELDGLDEQQEDGGVGLGVDLGTGVGQMAAPMATRYESSSESEAE